MSGFKRAGGRRKKVSGENEVDRAENTTSQRIPFYRAAVREKTSVQRPGEGKSIRSIRLYPMRLLGLGEHVGGGHPKGNILRGKS